MIKQPILIAVTAVTFGFSASSLAADTPGGITGGSASGTASQKCEGLSGPARDKCIQESTTARTPGRSEDAASREGGRTPGKSEDAASRTGVPPGTMDSSPLGAPAAGGRPKDRSSTTK